MLSILSVFEASFRIFPFFSYKLSSLRIPSANCLAAYEKQASPSSTRNCWFSRPKSRIATSRSGRRPDFSVSKRTMVFAHSGCLCCEKGWIQYTCLATLTLIISPLDTNLAETPKAQPLLDTLELAQFFQSHEFELPKYFFYMYEYLLYAMSLRH